jgi:hypothetical protein
MVIVQGGMLHFYKSVVTNGDLGSAKVQMGLIKLFLFQKMAKIPKDHKFIFLFFWFFEKNRQVAKICESKNTGAHYQFNSSSYYFELGRVVLVLGVSGGARAGGFMGGSTM